MKDNRKKTWAKDGFSIKEEILSAVALVMTGVFAFLVLLVFGV